MVIARRQRPGASGVPTILHSLRPHGRLLLIALLVRAAGTAAAQDPGTGPTPREAGDPFSSRGWHLELGGHYAIESWNYNISHEELSAILTGMTYGLRSGLVLTARSSLYHVSQRGVDGLLLGVTIGVRARIIRQERASIFLELELGVSDADTPVPPRGTRFNYLVLGGGGTTWRLKPGVHLLAGLRWIHVSNGGHAGRDRNPDIEAIGPQLGLLLAF